MARSSRLHHPGHTNDLRNNQAGLLSPFACSCGGRLLVVLLYSYFGRAGPWGVFCACCGGVLVRAVFEAVPSLLAVPLSSRSFVRDARTRKIGRTSWRSCVNMQCFALQPGQLHAQPRMMRSRVHGCTHALST